MSKDAAVRPTVDLVFSPPYLEFWPVSFEVRFAPESSGIQAVRYLRFQLCKSRLHLLLKLPLCQRSAGDIILTVDLFVSRIPRCSRKRVVVPGLADQESTVIHSGRRQDF